MNLNQRELESVPRSIKPSHVAIANAYQFGFAIRRYGFKMRGKDQARVPSAFSIKNTMRLSARSVISTLSPVSRIKLGMSITDSGSVQCTSRKSPGATDFSALRVFNAGSGHLRPVRSSFVVVMFRTWRSRRRSSMPQRFQAKWIPVRVKKTRPKKSDQACIGQEPDRLARLDERDLFAEFDQPVGIDQRRQQPCAFARKLHRLQRTVLAFAQGHADIFTPGDLLPVGEP